MANSHDKVANPGKTGQVETDKAIAELADAINAVRKGAIVGVPVLSLQASSSPGVIKVAHGLGYPASGWVITRVRGSGTVSVYEIQSPQPKKELWLQFVGSTEAVIDLRVF